MQKILETLKHVFTIVLLSHHLTLESFHHDTFTLLQPSNTLMRWKDPWRETHHRLSHVQVCVCPLHIRREGDRLHLVSSVELLQTTESCVWTSVFLNSGSHVFLSAQILINVEHKEDRGWLRWWRTCWILHLHQSDVWRVKRLQTCEGWNVQWRFLNTKTWEPFLSLEFQSTPSGIWLLWI